MCYCGYSDYYEICYKKYLPIGANEKQLVLSHEFRKYANTLFKRNTKWNLGVFPNPGLYPKHLSFEINYATNLFQNAIEYILMHEIAHIVHDHGAQDQESLNNEENIDFEYEADRTAYDLLVLGIDDDEMIQSIQVGAVLGLLSVLFSRQKLENTDHPADYKRVKALLSHYDIHKTNFAWGFAAMLLQKWTFTTPEYKSISIGDLTFETFKDHFEYVFNSIDGQS